MESTKRLWKARDKIKTLATSKKVTESKGKNEFKHQILPGPDPTSTFFSPFSCPFCLHISNAGENITCRDPIIGVGEPGKVIPKLCRFSNLSSSPASPVGGIITYKCVDSQWEVKKSDCISAPINSLLQLAKVILKLLTLSS